MWLATLALLTVSNVFMTFAWYGHLRHKQSALWLAILVSWLIAFVEYCFQVPANRLGSQCRHHDRPIEDDPGSGHAERSSAYFRCFI